MRQVFEKSRSIFGNVERIRREWSSQVPCLPKLTPVVLGRAQQQSSLTANDLALLGQDVVRDSVHWMTGPRGMPLLGGRAAHVGDGAKASLQSTERKTTPGHSFRAHVGRETLEVFA